MFKRTKFIISGLVVVFAAALFIPSVQVAAESALSIFRVQDTKTIKITVSDIQDIMTNLQSNGLLNKQQTQANVKTNSGEKQSQSVNQTESPLKPLNSIRDFTAFKFSLPTSVKTETPKLYATDAKTSSFVLNTARINAELSKLGAKSMVDNSFNGAKVTTNFSPSIIAEYSDFKLIATQGYNFDAPENVINNLWSSFISVPAIPEDLYSQLITVDPLSHNIYLPVIEGLGRETDLGSTTGYIYSTSDLTQVLSLIPSISDPKMLTELQNKSESALIWTKNGVLYLLIGQKTDSELSQIARSIR